MNMLLLDSYSFGNKKAQVFQIQEGLFLVEYYVNNALVNKSTHDDVLQAKRLADSYTSVDGSNKSLLNENA
mgnify:CR=1 FL=1|jgi:hypothetical protein